MKASRNDNWFESV